MPGRYALIVATDDYQDPKLSRLRTPATDASALARVLGDPAIGDFDVQLASNEPDHMLRRRIAAFFADRRRDDLLLLHFSCHGLKDDSGQLYFATKDTEVAYLDASAIPAEFVSRQMATSRSNSVLMLLDCCYSGAIARGLRFRAGDQVDVEDHLGGHGRAIITASSAMEYAFEGDELTGEGRPSVFTAAVVKALETGEADRDQDRWISVRELYDYVCDEVREVTPHQRPNLLSHLEGELFVARSRYLAPATLPQELLAALANPLSSVRVGAVAALTELLHGPDRALSAAAKERLESVAANDDSRRVTSAARDALEATGTTAPSTLPPFEALPAPPAEEPPPVAAREEVLAEPPVAATPPPAAVTAPEDAPPVEATAVETLHEDAGAPRSRWRRKPLPPPIEIAPPSTTADAVAPPPPPEDAPAAETPLVPAARPAAQPEWPMILLLLAGLALLLSATGLDWTYGGKLRHAVPSDGTVLIKLEALVVGVAGLAALVVVVLTWRRPGFGTRLRPWAVLVVLSGLVIGFVLGIYTWTGGYGLGIVVAWLGALAVIVAAGAAAPPGATGGTRERALAAAGAALVLYAATRWDDWFGERPGFAVFACVLAVAAGIVFVIRPLRTTGLILAAAGGVQIGLVWYAQVHAGLIFAFAGGILMIVAGLLVGDARQDDGVGAAVAEGQEGAQDALSQEARRRQHA